jgi:signal transduction histidine kinase/ActR/RegA family two-component response regulator
MGALRIRMPEPIRVALVGVAIDRARPLLQALNRRGLTASCHELPDAALPGAPLSRGSWDLVIHAGSRPESLSGLIGLRIGAGQGNGPEFVLEGTSESPPIRLGEDPERVASQVGQALLYRRLERELRDLRAEASERARQQEVVTELGVRALSGIDLGEFLEEALRALAGTLDVPLAAVFERVPGSELILMRAGQGWRDGLVGHLLLVSSRDTLVARALAVGEPVIEEWTDAEAVWRAMPLLHEHGVRCGVNVALGGPHGPRGVLGAYATSSRPFSRHDVLFAQGVANVLAAAISRKGTEEGLIQSQERLQSVQKMEAIGRLAGGIAHDFNNLVQAIAGYTEILLRRLPEHDPLHHHAVEIKRAGDRAAGLTRQLLQFARRQVLQSRVLDLNAVVTNIEQLLRRLIGEDIELETELTASLGRVRADSTQIEQILMNLAVNSRDAMPDGGTLTIETRNVTLSKADQREAFAIRPGPYVMLAVTDTGIGMDAETRAHAFEPFFTTKAPGQGTGLGLSTVYGIVKQSDGYIWVDSEPAHGTRVRIYLPAVDEPVQAVEVRRPVVTAAAPRGSETLLLVEDEEGVRELISEWLTGHGYAVLAAGNGTEAIALAEGHTGPIDLLIADVIMPQMGGPALAARLVPMRPEMRVIYMSGYADEAIGDPDVLAAGAAFLQKPFSLDVLVRKIREILDAAAPVG